MSNNFLGGFGVTTKQPVGGTGGPFFFAVTRLQLLNQIAANTIVPGATYQVTDLSDNLGIFLKGLQPNEVSVTGSRLQYVPRTYNIVNFNGYDWNGVYDPAGVYAAGELVIWGNRVWRNLTGAVGSVVDLYTLSADWVEEPFTNDLVYDIVPFGIVYDLNNNWISLQWDEFNNVAGVAFPLAGSYTYNPVDRTDWNYNTAKQVTNNRWFQFLNNRGLFNTIADNDIQGNLNSNVCSDAIVFNKVSGDVANNTVQVISGNVITGLGITFNTANNIRFNYSTQINLNINVTELSFNVCSIILNNNCPDISFNTCYQINNNTVAGQISTNRVSNTISGNNIPGAIQNNIAQGITTNTNQGNIVLNVIPETINGNSNIGSINSNCCNAIFSNSNNGSINENSNTGSVVNNSNSGSINNNSNNGSILNNANTGNITFNQNNGAISGIGAATTNITQNTNNGFIITTVVGVITDPVVNK